MGCFTQPVSVMGDLLVGSGIILLLIHVSSVQETPQVPYAEGVPQTASGTPLSLYKCPRGVLNASASPQAVCQELECLCLHLEDQEAEISVCFASVQHIFFFPLLSLITSSCLGSCLRNTGYF